MHPSRPSLFIIAHGSTVSREAHAAAAEHALTLRQSNRYGSIAVCFLTETDTLPDLPLGEVYLLPFFMSNGYFVSRKIPKLFGLTNGRKVEKERVILQCDALGMDPELSRIIVAMGIETCTQGALEPENTHLVLVAHGSEKSKASADATYFQQRAVKEKKVFGDVSSVFLNEEPELENWLVKNVDDVRPKVLVGLFTAEGPHAMKDVPESIDRAQRRVAVPHTTYYSGIVGTRPEIVKLIQDSVTRCAVTNRV
jgi:sirohydrochlorin cobaltochelatase